MAVESYTVITDLPCNQGCPFEKRCAEKLEDGTCKDKIKKFAKNGVFPFGNLGD